MTAPAKARRCGCGRPATHRLKGGLGEQRWWSRHGVSVVLRPVRLDAVCRACAAGCQRAFGGRVYRWRRVGAR